MSYRQWQVQQSPSWLQGYWGTRWLQVMGVCKDVITQGIDLAVKVRHIANSAPDDVLVPAGHDRRLERAPGESTASYRARLVAAWDAYEWGGTRKGLVDQLAIAGFPNVRIVTGSSLVGADYDTGPGSWARFRVYVYQPHLMGDGTGLPKYGDGHRWGDGTRYGGLPADRVELLRRVIKKWKPAHSKVVGITVVLAGKLWGDGWHYADGTRYGGTVVKFAL